MKELDNLSIFLTFFHFFGKFSKDKVFWPLSPIKYKNINEFKEISTVNL
jgi:hypothetical protein